MKKLITIVLLFFSLSFICACSHVEMKQIDKEILVELLEDTSDSPEIHQRIDYFSKKVETFQELDRILIKSAAVTWIHYSISFQKNFADWAQDSLAGRFTISTETKHMYSNLIPFGLFQRVKYSEESIMMPAQNFKQQKKYLTSGDYIELKKMLETEFTHTKLGYQKRFYEIFKSNINLDSFNLKK
jgi:hypothetical protein